MRSADRPVSLADERVRRTYELGRKAHPQVDLSFEEFARRARAAIPKHDNKDFYLAVACDAGAPGAWERLQSRFHRPLRAMLRRRGATRHDVSQLLDDVWGRLASPPPRAKARTRIGTYDGQGALLAWLATVAWHRLADGWRRAAGVAPLPQEPTPSTPRGGDPADRLEASEIGALIGSVLEQAWASLTDRELEVVVLKYRQLLPQTEIARILRVSPSRITRLLQSATRRLREAVEERLELRAHVAGAASNQAALQHLLQRMLSESDAGREDADDHGRGMA